MNQIVVENNKDLGVEVILCQSPPVIHLTYLANSNI